MRPQEPIEGYSFDDDSFVATLTLRSGRSADELETTCQKATALARHRLNVLLSEGQIGVFEVQERLARQLARRLAGLHEGQTVEFTFAAGAPELEGLYFDFSPQEGTAIGSVTIGAPVTALAAWRPPWLTLLARRNARARQLEDEIVAAQLEALLFRARAGAGQGRAEPLIRLSRLLSAAQNGVLPTGSIKHMHDIYVIVRSPDRLSSSMAWATLLSQIRDAVTKRTLTHAEPAAFRILRDSLMCAIEAATRGPQALGYELPLVSLAAVALPPLSNDERHDDDLAFFLEVAKSLASSQGLRPGQATEVTMAPFAGVDSREAFAKAIRHLEQSSWVDKSHGSDSIRIAADVVTAPFFIGNRAIRPSYRAALRRAHDAVDTVAVSGGGIYAISLCLSDDVAEGVRRRLEEAWQGLAAPTFAAKPGDQIYQVMAQFLPLTSQTPHLGKGLGRSASSEAAFGTEWCKLVLREMIGMQEFRSDPEWIAAKLLPRISKHAISEALSELKRTGMVREDPQLGRLVQVNQDLRTEDEVGGEAVIKFHRSMIALTSAVLSSGPADRRFLAAMSLWIGESQVADYRERIVSLLREIFELADGRPGGDQVYQLNAQLFPLTCGLGSPGARARPTGDPK